MLEFPEDFTPEMKAAARRLIEVLTPMSPEEREGVMQAALYMLAVDKTDEELGLSKKTAEGADT